jgi:hypothetical protein
LDAPIIEIEPVYINIGLHSEKAEKAEAAGFPTASHPIPEGIGGVFLVPLLYHCDRHMSKSSEQKNVGYEEILGLLETHGDSN